VSVGGELIDGDFVLKMQRIINLSLYVSEKDLLSDAIFQLKSRASCIERENQTKFVYQWLLRRNKDGKYLLTDHLKKMPKGFDGWTVVGKFEQSEKVV
jgi:hypothetical protein